MLMFAAIYKQVAPMKQGFETANNEHKYKSKSKNVIKK